MEKGKIRKDIENVKKGDNVLVESDSGIKYEGVLVSKGSKNIKIKTQSETYGEQILTFPTSNLQAFIQTTTF